MLQLTPSRGGVCVLTGLIFRFALGFKLPKGTHTHCWEVGVRFFTNPLAPPADPHLSPAHSGCSCPTVLPPSPGRGGHRSLGRVRGGLLTQEAVSLETVTSQGRAGRWLWSPQLAVCRHPMLQAREGPRQSTRLTSTPYSA